MKRLALLAIGAAIAAASPAAASELPPRMLGEWCMTARTDYALKSETTWPCRRGDIKDNRYISVSARLFSFNQQPCRILSIEELPQDTYQYEGVDDRLLTVVCQDPMIGQDRRRYWLWVTREGSRRLGVQDITNGCPTDRECLSPVQK